jgi:glycine oxidase
MNVFPKTAEVAIAGGGVIGLAVARSLAQRGIKGVVVIERGTLGAEASSAAAGMLAPQAEADAADEFFNLCCRSRDMYAHFAQALYEESGVDIELDTTGTLYLAFTEHDKEEIDHRYRWQTDAGLSIDKLSSHDLRQLEPCISEQVIAGLKFPLDIQVENRRLVSALATSNARAGVKLMTGTSVQSVQIERGQVKGVETSQGLITVNTIVLAGGAWTTFISSSDQAFPKITIEPVRGHMLSFECNPRIARHVIYSPRGYIVPRRDGRLLAGSTTEHAGFDKSVTARAVYSVLSHALEISPTISNLPLVDSWAGLRPRSPDDLPVLGPCSVARGLFYATGHYRNGILLAPLTGDLIAGAIADNVISPLLEAFVPDRFEMAVVK